MAKNVRIFVSVPEDCMGLVIGTGGKHINEIKRETRMRIKPWDGDSSVKRYGFEVTGKPIGCEKARQAIQRRIVSSLHVLHCFVLMLLCCSHYVYKIDTYKG